MDILCDVGLAGELGRAVVNRSFSNINLHFRGVVFS